MEAGDAEETVKCEAELAALENNALARADLNGGSAAIKLKASPMKAAGVTTQQERLALLNAKNRGKNADDVRKALLEERRKLHKERERTKAEAAAKAAETERKQFLGVPAKSDLSELFGDSDMSRAGTPMSGTSTPMLKARRSRAGTPALNGVKKEKSGLGMVGKKKGMDDELADLDLGIDVEI